MASLRQPAVLVELLNCAVGNEIPPEQPLCAERNLIGAKQSGEHGSESGSTASDILCSRPCRGGPRPGTCVAWLALADDISQRHDTFPQMPELWAPKDDAYWSGLAQGRVPRHLSGQAV